MPQFISPIASLLFAAVLVTLVGGCERPVESCSEFDPPPGKAPTDCPPKAAAIQAQPAQPARYCYSSLAQVECYAEPQPGRTGYMGSTEAPPPTESVAKKSDKPASGKVKPVPVQPAADQASSPAASAAAEAPTPLKPASAN
jgi:hypothetical protein